jgi:hypothetical protein
MALLGPLVRNAFFFVAAVLILPLLMLIVPGKMAAVEATGNPAEQRLARAQQERQRRARRIGGILGILILTGLGLHHVYGQAAPSLSPPTPVAASGDTVRVALASVADGNLHRFVAELDGVPVRFIVVVAGEPGHVGTAFDACEICGSQGYYQDGPTILCLHCRSAVYAPSIGQGGGCNPIPLPSRIESGEVGDRARRAARRRPPVPPGFLGTMFLRLLLESLRQARRRKLVAVAAVGLGTFAATAVATLLLTSGDQLAAELASYGANLELTPATGETLAVSGLAKARTIFWRHNLVGVAPLRTQRVGWTLLRPELAGRAPRELVAPLVGTWFDVVLDGGWRTGLPHTRPTLLPDGRWPGDSASEVVVGRRLAKRLGAASGDRVAVRLGERTLDLTVVGVLAGGGEEEDQGFAPLGALDTLADGAGGVQRAEVLALTVPERDVSPKDPTTMSAAAYDAWYCTAYASSIARQLEEAVPRRAGGGGAVGRRRRRRRTASSARRAAAFCGAAARRRGARHHGGDDRHHARAPARSRAFRRARRRDRSRSRPSSSSRRRCWVSRAASRAACSGSSADACWAPPVFGVQVPWAPVLLPFAVAAGVAVALFGSAPPVLRSVRGDAARSLRRATA